MTERRTISAEMRRGTGKGAARAVRREGRVPAVIYGDGKDPETISLAFNELVQHLQRGRFLSTLYEVHVDGKSERVLPRDVQFNVITDLPIHVDFMRVGRGKRVPIMVPVHFVNEEESPGLKRGGVLNVVRHDVEVMCPADDIPDALEADLTGLEIGDNINISQISLPANATPTITDRDFTVATIAAPTIMAATEEEEEAEAEEGEEAAEEGAEGEGEAEGAEDGESGSEEGE